MQTGKGVGGGLAICEANCEVWAEETAVTLKLKVTVVNTIKSLTLAILKSVYRISKKGFKDVVVGCRLSEGFPELPLKAFLSSLLGAWPG